MQDEKITAFNSLHSHYSHTEHMVSTPTFKFSNYQQNSLQLAPSHKYVKKSIIPSQSQCFLDLLSHKARKIRIYG